MSHTYLFSCASYGMKVTLADHLALFLGAFLFLVGQLCFLIRQRVSLRPEEALFFFVNNSLPPSSSPLSAVYEVAAPLHTHTHADIVNRSTNIFTRSSAFFFLKLFASLSAHSYINAKFCLTHKHFLPLHLNTTYQKCHHSRKDMLRKWCCFTFLHLKNSLPVTHEYLNKKKTNWQDYWHSVIKNHHL